MNRRLMSKSQIQASQNIISAGNAYKAQEASYEHNIGLESTVDLSKIQQNIKAGKQKAQSWFDKTLTDLTSIARNMDINSSVYLVSENEKLASEKDKDLHRKYLLNQTILNNERTASIKDDYISLLLVVLGTVFLLFIEYLLFALRLISFRMSNIIMGLTLILGIGYFIYVLLYNPNKALLESIERASAETAREYEIALGLVDNSSGGICSKYEK